MVNKQYNELVEDLDDLHEKLNQIFDWCDKNVKDPNGEADMFSTILMIMELIKPGSTEK